MLQLADSAAMSSCVSSRAGWNTASSSPPAPENTPPVTIISAFHGLHFGDVEWAYHLPDKPPYSPYAGRNFPTRPLFGDTHVHTSYSLDAGAAGCRLGPVEVLRFGKGEEITASSGQRVKLPRPLDFMVVADHSDGLSLFPRLIAGDRELLGAKQFEVDCIFGGNIENENSYLYQPIDIAVDHEDTLYVLDAKAL